MLQILALEHFFFLLIPGTGYVFHLRAVLTWEMDGEIEHGERNARVECVCVCERERERARASKREKQARRKS